MHDRPFFRRAPHIVRRANARRSAWPLVLGFIFATTGCAPSLGNAVRAYEHGRYPEAMEELRAVEADASSGTRCDAARYALYRGLAHLALGDIPSTRRWLGRVRDALDVDSALLSADDAGRLASAWAHLR